VAWIAVHLPASTPGISVSVGLSQRALGHGHCLGHSNKHFGGWFGDSLRLSMHARCASFGCTAFVGFGCTACDVYRHAGALILVVVYQCGNCSTHASSD
jgi:hypothetical protein